MSGLVKARLAMAFRELSLLQFREDQESHEYRGSQPQSSRLNGNHTSPSRTCYQAVPNENLDASMRIREMGAVQNSHSSQIMPRTHDAENTNAAIFAWRVTPAPDLGVNLQTHSIYKPLIHVYRVYGQIRIQEV